MRNTLPINLSRELRQKQTEAESLLWSKLRNRQLNGIKFRRQQRIDNYIVDFISFEKKLIIELDGGQHNETPAIENDEQRTKCLGENGYQVLRLWNNDVMRNIEGVLIKITEYLNQCGHPHLASPVKGEESDLEV